MWLDIDILGPGHKAINLPANEAEALELLAMMRLAPSVLVRSGGGLQAWWLFAEPWIFADDADRNRAAVLAASWVMTAQAHGNAREWKVDSTKDLARVLRVAGTYNRKHKPVLIAAEYFGHRYQPSDFDEFIYADLAARVVTEAPGTPASDEDVYIASMAVDCLSAARSDDRDEWIAVGMALKTLCHEPAGFAMFERFSQKSSKYESANCRETWESFKPNGQISMASLIFRARTDAGKVAGVDDLPAKTAWQLNPPPAAKPGEYQPTPVAPPVTTIKPMPVIQGGPRQRIANVIDAKVTAQDGEERNVVQHRTLESVYGLLAESTQNWPRRAGGVLFVAKENVTDLLPTHRDITWLTNTDKLFAWMQRIANIRWTTKSATDAVSGKPLSPATKKEFFEYLIHYCEPSYDGVEVLPHEPPLEDLYYLPCDLNVTDALADGGPLDELVAKFNAETDEDRLLLLAALMTPGWGGPCGARPMFVFTSEHGRGVGKSSTASLFGDIWGGTIGIGADEDWAKVRGRLLGDDALGKRCVLLDNLKGKLSNGDIEGIITSGVIDGWKPYHGQASRPNNLTWYVTANTPTLSRDLADRSIVIKLGKQRPGEDFLGWSRAHIARHRKAIVAGLLALLRREPTEEIQKKNRDRWAAWQVGVLAKLGSANDLAAKVCERRSTVDADTEDAEDVAHAVVELIAEAFPDHDARRIFISRQQIYWQLQKKGLGAKDMGPKAYTTWLRGMANSGPLHFLAETKYQGERGWYFTGAGYPVGKKVDFIPDDPSDAYGWRK